MSKPATTAATVYNARVAEIRRSLPSHSREFSDAMTEASAKYEAAMIADIGVAAATQLGAGQPRLGKRGT